jgi:protein-arginine kinase activator protein McsA
MDSSRPLASSIRISPAGAASVSPVEDVSLNQGDLLTQQVVRSNLAEVNTPSRKRPREKILKSGLCDSCSSTMSAVWRKNKTQCDSCYSKSYKETHREEIAAKDQAYYQAHKEELLAKRKAHYQSHKEEIAVKGKAYRKARREELLAKGKIYREKRRNEKKELATFLESIDWKDD